MIYLQRASNVEVGSVTPVDGTTSVRFELTKNITTNPKTFIQIESMAIMQYSLYFDSDSNEYVITLESGKTFSTGDKVNYFVIYL